MLLMVREAVYVLFTGVECRRVLFRSCWLPNARELGERVTAKVVPVPLRLTVCGLPAALSVTLTAALLAPVVVGVNVTVRVQEIGRASCRERGGQLVVGVKSQGLGAVSEMLLMVSGAVAVLVKVVVCAVLVLLPSFLPNARELGERVTAEVVPVPFRLTVCGLPAALSVTLTAALLAPVVVGVNVTVRVQVPLRARVEGLRGKALAWL